MLVWHLFLRQSRLQSNIRRRILTDCSDHLRLKTKLRLKPLSEICHASLAISRDVRRLPDTIEHITACESENGDQAESRPKIAMLNQGHDPRSSDYQQRDEAQETSDSRCKPEIVGRATKRLAELGGYLAFHPSMNVFGRLGTEGGSISYVSYWTFVPILQWCHEPCSEI